MVLLTKRKVILFDIIITNSHWQIYIFLQIFFTVFKELDNGYPKLSSVIYENYFKCEMTK